MEKMEIVIPKEQENERIDKFLSASCPGWSRSQIQQWIKEGHVLVDGKKIKTNYKLSQGDKIEISVPAETEDQELKPEKIHLDILYEDDYLLVINKPKGMVVHPAPGHMTGTLVNGLLAHCENLSALNGPLRPGIVHRIDKDTSGLLVVAKNDQVHGALVNQLKEKKAVRKYYALVHGNIPHDHGTVDAPIGRDPKDRKRMAVIDGGKHAVTHFRVLERFDHYTFIECLLETGRTHQIRVHMRYIGFPLAGDPKYGPRKTLDIGGQALHAGTLGFIHPETEQYMEFEAPLPLYFERLLESLRR